MNSHDFDSNKFTVQVPVSRLSVVSVLKLGLDIFGFSFWNYLWYYDHTYKNLVGWFNWLENEKLLWFNLNGYIIVIK